MNERSGREGEGNPRSLRRNILRLLIAAFFLLLWVVASSHAQVTDTTRVLVRGVVVDASTGLGIRDVQLSAIGGPSPARSDSAGKFALETHAGGAALVLVRRLGYAPHVFTIQLADASSREFVLELEYYVPTLDTVMVRAVTRVARSRLDVFEMRRSTAIGGHFITAADLERRGVPFTSNAFYGVSGVQVGRDRFGQAQLINTREGCRYRMGLDGMLLEDFDVDQIHPNEVHGIEIYSGPSTVPAEYLGSHRITCGLIMIWTR